MKSGVWNQVLTYLYLRKKNPDDPKSLDLKFMHGMNRISLLMFVVAVIIMLIRLLK